MSGSAGAVRVDRALRGRSAGAAAYPRFRVWAYNFVDIPANYHMAKYIRPVIRGLVSWCSHRQICITVTQLRSFVFVDVVTSASKLESGTRDAAERRLKHH